MALLLAKIVILIAKYSDFANVFMKKLSNILPKQIRVNKYAIKLEKDKQPPYKPIYILRLIELETLKTYIKSNLANGFIQALKLLADALIIFVYKLNKSLCLYVHY